MRPSSIFCSAIAIAAFVATAACGSNTPPAPTAASAVVDHTAPPAAAVSVSGTIAKLSGACPAVTFTVDGTSVATSSSTIFNAGSCGALANGTTVAVQGKLQQGTLLATSVRTLPPRAVSVRGIVSAVTGACPTLTFVVNGRTIATTSSTTFSEGTCTDVTNGTFATVEGTTTQQGSISASTVRLAIPSVEITGTISALAGSCPAITMTVNRTAIAATSSTNFVGATCVQLVNGVRVGVEGVRMANGTVTARRIVARP